MSGSFLTHHSSLPSIAKQWCRTSLPRGTVPDHVRSQRFIAGRKDRCRNENIIETDPVSKFGCLLRNVFFDWSRTAAIRRAGANGRRIDGPSGALSANLTNQHYQVLSAELCRRRQR